MRVKTLEIARKGLWLLPFALFFVIVLNFKLSKLIMPGYFIYDIKRMLEIALFLFVFLYLLLSVYTRRYFLEFCGLFPDLVRILILCLFALGTISVALAAVFKMAILGYSFTFLLVVATVFVAAQRVRYGEVTDKLILFLIILGVIVYEPVFFTVYIKQLLHGGKLKSFPGFANIRFLAQYLCWILPLVSLPLSRLKKRSGFLGVFLYLIIGLLWAIAIANGAKGLFLSIILSLIFASIIFRKAIKPWLTIQLQLVGIGIIFYLILFILLAKLSGADFTISSTLSRIQLWHIALQMIIHHPLIGVGPLHFSHHVNTIAAHPHNSLFLIGAEWGLPALLIVCVIYIWALISWSKRYNYKTMETVTGQQVFIPFALTVSLVAGSLYSLASGVIVMPISQVMLVLVCGWMLGVYYKNEKIEVQPHFLREVIFMLVLGVFVLCLLFGIVPDVFRLTVAEVKWALMHVHNHRVLFAPRFWFQGWF